MKRIGLLLALSTSVALCQAPSQSTTANSLTGNTSVTGQRIGAIYQADQFSGADAGAKISACLSAVETGGGGTCDAQNLSGSLTSASSITVGDGIHRTTLLLPATAITMAPGVNVFYRAYSTIAGLGYLNSSEVICTNPTAASACVQSYHEPSGALYNAYLHDFQIAATGRPVTGSAALRLGGSGYVDVLSSNFERLMTGGFDYGTDINSQGGCICYNKLLDVNNRALSIALYVHNGSTYNAGFNSNQVLSGQEWAPIGLLDYGSGMNTYAYLDFEGNRSSTGKILWANPDGLNQGNGYAVGDTVRPGGGDSTAVLTVAKVGRNGAATALTVTAPGTNYSNAQTVATTMLTGSGSGLKVDVRTGAYMVLVSGMGPYGYGYGGNIVQSPYEEAGAGDYWCGTGYNLMGTVFGTNGAAYSHAACNGISSGYGGPMSNFEWGAGSTPLSIGIRGGGGSRSIPAGYIAFSSGTMFDGNLLRSGQWYQDSGGNARTQPVNLFANGPAYNSTAFNTYAEYGHSPWNVGESIVYGGTAAHGRTTLEQLSENAPKLTAYGGTGTTYTYYLVGKDYNGGVTMPVSASISGPTALGALITVTAKAAGAGYVVNDVVALPAIRGVGGGDGTGTATVRAVTRDGGVTALSVNHPGTQYSANGAYSQNTWAVTGGTGRGLMVNVTATYILVTAPHIDGISHTYLRNGTSTQVTPCSMSGFPGQVCVDYGQTAAYTPPTRNSTGDATIAGNLTVAGEVAFGKSQQTYYDINGLEHQAATAPTASAGTLTGTNSGGYITGLSATTSITITFANSGWTTWAGCVWQPYATGGAGYVSSTAGLKTRSTYTFGAAYTGSIGYHCDGN